MYVTLISKNEKGIYLSWIYVDVTPNYTFIIIVFYS